MGFPISGDQIAGGELPPMTPSAIEIVNAAKVVADCLGPKQPINAVAVRQLLALYESERTARQALVDKLAAAQAIAAMMLAAADEPINTSGLSDTIIAVAVKRVLGAYGVKLSAALTKESSRPVPKEQE